VVWLCVWWGCLVGWGRRLRVVTFFLCFWGFLRRRCAGGFGWGMGGLGGVWGGHFVCGGWVGFPVFGFGVVGGCWGGGVFWGGEFVGVLFFFGFRLRFLSFEELDSDWCLHDRVFLSSPFRVFKIFPYRTASPTSPSGLPASPVKLSRPRPRPQKGCLLSDDSSKPLFAYPHPTAPIPPIFPRIVGDGFIRRGFRASLPFPDWESDGANGGFPWRHVNLPLC